MSRSLGPVLPSTRKPWIVQTSRRPIACCVVIARDFAGRLAADDRGGEQILHVPEHPRDDDADLDVVRHHFHRGGGDQAALLPLRRGGAPGITHQRLADRRPRRTRLRQIIADPLQRGGGVMFERGEKQRSACREKPCRGCRAPARCPRSGPARMCRDSPARGTLRWRRRPPRRCRIRAGRPGRARSRPGEDLGVCMGDSNRPIGP